MDDNNNNKRASPGRVLQWGLGGDSPPARGCPGVREPRKRLAGSLGGGSHPTRGEPGGLEPPREILRGAWANPTEADPATPIWFPAGRGPGSTFVWDYTAERAKTEAALWRDEGPGPPCCRKPYKSRLRKLYCDPLQATLTAIGQAVSKNCGRDFMGGLGPPNCN